MKKNLKRTLLASISILIGLFIFLANIPNSVAKAKEEESLFISGEINLNNGNYSLTNIKYKTILGKSISNIVNKEPMDKDKILCSYMDEEKNILKEEKIQNPFYRRVSSDEDISNYTTKAFVIKTNYSPEIKFIKLSTIKDNNSKVEIGTISLNLSKSSYIMPVPNEFKVEKIIDNGAPNKKINIVIMGDGFTAQEQDSFLYEAKKIGNYLLEDKAYTNYKDMFNIYAVEVVSNASGVATDPNNLIDNYFGSTFNYGGIERLLHATKYNTVFETASTYVPEYDHIIILANSSTYGGAGGDYSTVSINSSAPEITLHETGHSLVGLSDEYWAGSIYAKENINMTQNSDPNTVRWKDLIGIDGIGVYQITEGENWYCPHESCKMRYLGYDFCAVCARAHKERFEEIIEEKSKNELTTSFDLNKDGSIDISDLSTLALYYKVTSNDSNWKAEYDLNNDNIIDICDLVLLATKIE